MYPLGVDICRESSTELLYGLRGSNIYYSLNFTSKINLFK